MDGSLDFMNKKISLNFKDHSTYHDRVLIVRGEKFYVVSGVLSLWSEHFLGMFSGNFSESDEKEIELKELDPAEFEIFLQVLHKNSPEDIKAEHLLFLIDLSYRFLAPNVLAICKDFIDKNPNELINLLGLLDKVCTYGVEDLKEKLIAAIQKIASTSDIVDMLKTAVKHDLENLKDWIFDNLDSFLVSSNCPNLLECAANLHLPVLKEKIIADITTWPGVGYSPDDEDIIELVKSAFKHDVAILKEILRDIIFNSVGHKNPDVTVNIFFEEHYEEIMKLPEDIRDFIIRSTFNPK